MRTGKSLLATPIFPDWMLSGKIELSDQQVNDILTEVSGLTPIKTDYGFCTPNGTIGPVSLGFTKIFGGTFYDEVVSHFRLEKEYRNIECVDAQFHSIKPGQCIPPSVTRHRWYRSVAFLQAPVAGSSVVLEQFGGKLYSSPPGVQDYNQIIKGEPNKISFWPAHIPWGFTTNKSSKDTIVFTSSFIIKR